MSTGLVGAILLLGAVVTKAADHRDSPRLMANISFEGNLDINDVYLFQSPTTKDNTVIIVTLSPAAGVVGPAIFHSYAIYEVRIQNTAAIADNFSFQFSFSNPDAYGRQTMQVVKHTAKNQPLATQFGTAPASAISDELLALGTTGKTLALKGGGKVMAGLFDDPFFFDLNAFNKFAALARAGAPLAQRVAPFLPPNFPDNFFGNFNVLALVMEVPTSTLVSSKSNPKIGVWVRTEALAEQIDRMGRPAVNTAAITPELKDVFNTGTPMSDTVLFTPGMVDDIMTLYGVPFDYALTLSKTLLPDVLTMDTSKSSGFLNGRKLTDDVIDAEFSLLTDGALTTDRVGNDSVFSDKFPYLGSAQPRAPLP